MYQLYILLINILTKSNLYFCENNQNTFLIYIRLQIFFFNLCFQVEFNCQQCHNVYLYDDLSKLIFYIFV